MTVSIASEFKVGSGVLFACFVGVGIGFSSLNYYTAGIFMASLESEFGWSRGIISAQALIGVFALVLLSPYIGTLVDKAGTRLVASVSLVFYGLSFWVLSVFLDSIATFISISLVTAVVAAGSTPVTFTRTITSWFDRSRGIALGLSLVGTGVAGFLAPLLLAPFIAENGWRAGAQVLSALVISGGIIVALLLRDKKQPNETQKDDARPSTHLSTKSISKMHLTSVFWLLALAFFFVAFAVSGLIVHFIPMLKDNGMSLEETGKYASVIGLAVVCGRLIVGFLIDRFFAPHVAMCVFILVCIALFLFAILGQDMALVAAFAVGLAMGAEVDLISFLTSRYFGLANYGKVYGRLYAVFIIGSALSVVMMGFMFDYFGSYSQALTVSITALFIAIALIYLLPNYQESVK